MTEKTLEEDFGPHLRRDVIRRVSKMRPDGTHVLEIGTARNASENAEISDGWSTKWWAEHASLVDGKVFSVDKAPYSIEQSKKVVPEEWHKYVTWIEGDGPGKFLVGHPELLFDIVYLDAADDPFETLLHFGLALCHRMPHTLFLLDDTQCAGGSPEGKATFVLSLARRRGWSIIHFCGHGYRMSLVEIE